MIDDGSFEKIFLAHHQSAIKRADLLNRKIFVLENPLLSPETPLDKAELWFDHKH